MGVRRITICKRVFPFFIVAELFLNLYLKTFDNINSNYDHCTRIDIGTPVFMISS